MPIPIRLIATAAGVAVASAVVATMKRSTRTCDLCARAFFARDPSQCHRCRATACDRCMQRAANVHELPLVVVDAATCERCVRHARDAMARYEQALRELDTIAIFPIEFDELAPIAGLNRAGLPNELEYTTRWHTTRDDAIRELKLVARFHLMEMVRFFKLTKAEGKWRAYGVASPTESYGALKPGFNF